MMLNVYGIDKDKYASLFERVFRSALDFIGQTEKVEVELGLVSEEEIKEVNLESRGIDSVTDVLSFPALDCEKRAVTQKEFPYDINPESGNIVLGEIIICLKRATEQSEEFGHGLERELGFLLAHGMLHLFGYDHMVEDEEREMRFAQNAILEKIDLTR